VRSAVEPHLEFVQAETLTSSVVFGEGTSEGSVGDGLKVKVAVAKV
jgi:isoleucyl-tRNA synthetase